MEIIKIGKGKLVIKSRISKNGMPCLLVIMTPPIPGTQKLKPPIPKGTKMFNYDETIYTYLSVFDIFDLYSYLTGDTESISSGYLEKDSLLFVRKTDVMTKMLSFSLQQNGVLYINMSIVKQQRVGIALSPAQTKLLLKLLEGFFNSYFAMMLNNNNNYQNRQHNNNTPEKDVNNKLVF